MKNLIFILIFFGIFFSCQNTTPSTLTVADDKTVMPTKDTLKEQRQKMWDEQAKNQQEELSKEKQLVFYYNSRKNENEKMGEAEYVVRRVNGKTYNFIIKNKEGIPLPGSRVVFTYKKGDPAFEIKYSAW